MPGTNTRRLVTVLTPCFNEVTNVAAVWESVARVTGRLNGRPSSRDVERADNVQGFSIGESAHENGDGARIEFIHLFVDNASTDGTQEELRRLAARDPRVHLIFNQRNFGHVRSPYHGLLQAEGDAVIVLAADLQDPPELIGELLARWKAGSQVVFGQKVNSAESPLFFEARKAYYRLVKRMADVELIENVTGFGLYDRSVIEAFRELNEPYPYVRGLISELGFAVALVPYEQPKRLRGTTKNNLYTLYDVAMLGITSHSKVPLRLATMLGFASSAVSFFVGLVYLIYKLVYWERFPLGVAPVVIGLFFFASVQLFFIGVIGEYIGAIHTRVTKRPLVIEKERINF